MPNGERRLAAIMYTDIVGYTALTQKDESSTLHALERHRSLLRPLFSSHGGREIKTIGDAFLVEFQSALDAVLCAVAIQQMMHDRKVARGEQLSLRIGIHVGDVVESGSDILGDAVNIASRVYPLAEPGGICISEEVQRQVGNKLDLPLLFLGEKSLKNVVNPVSVYSVGMPWERSSPVEAGEQPTNRIAVLPFVSMSSDPNDEYFSDGLTEELIDRLCQIGELKVIARTSVMGYKKKDMKAAEIGRELKVGSLVEGSVRKEGKKVRVTAQLINANTEEHLWSSRYDRDLEGIFAVQSDVARQVAEALRVRVLSTEMERIDKKPTESAEAYTLYLKGRYYWNERTNDALAKAIRYFELAIERDPRCALAYAGLSDAYVLQTNYEYASPAKAMPKAMEYVTKALETDDALAEAHASLAMVRFFNWDFRGAGSEFKRAIELNPSYAIAHLWYGDYFWWVERDAKKTIAEKVKARELDPLSPTANLSVGVGYYCTREYCKALEELRKTAERFEGLPSAHLWAAEVLMSLGRFEEGLEEVDRAAASPSDELMVAFARGIIYAAWGKTDLAVMQLEVLQKLTGVRDVDPSDFGAMFAALGRSDEAFQWFDIAYKERSPASVDNLLLHPFVADKLKSDPRWTQLLGRLGLPP